MPTSQESAKRDFLKMRKKIQIAFFLCTPVELLRPDFNQPELLKLESLLIKTFNFYLLQTSPFYVFFIAHLNFFAMPVAVFKIENC